MSSTAGYGEAADTLAEQYESLSFADVHGDVLHLFPTEPNSVLDIGAAGQDPRRPPQAARPVRLAAAGPGVTAVSAMPAWW
jgi:hypothetical protein